MALRLQEQFNAEGGGGRGDVGRHTTSSAASFTSAGYSSSSLFFPLLYLFFLSFSFWCLILVDSTALDEEIARALQEQFDKEED